MSSSSSSSGRAQVVYYLSHGGRLEQPHLIEVEQHRNAALCLSDVKQRLKIVRGKEMPDAFSWAYKRGYKNDFIWSDVTENDIILPLGDEYIIKGSVNIYSTQEIHIKEENPENVPTHEIQNNHLKQEEPRNSYNQQRNGEKTPVTAVCKNHQKNGVNHQVKNHQAKPANQAVHETYDRQRSDPKPVNQVTVLETYEKIMKPSPIRSPMNNRRDSFGSEGSAVRVNRQLMEILTESDEIIRDPDSDGSSNANFTDIKVYKTPASPVTADHGTDAATQTEDDSRRSSVYSQQQQRQQEHEQYSPSVLRKPVVKRQTEEPGKVVKQTSAMVLRQLLSCGGIDTNTCPSMHSSSSGSRHWVKSKSDTKPVMPDLESVSSPRISHDVRSSNSRPSSFSLVHQDPDFMPEVVKEATCLARDVTPKQQQPQKQVFQPSEKRSVNKTPRPEPPVPELNRVLTRFTPKGGGTRKVEDSSPRLSTRRTPALKSANESFQLPTSPGLHWGDLSPPKKELKCKDDRPLTPGRSRLDWEKTLQEAVILSTPPADFRQSLQECPQCGRTFKPDSLKIHLRGCHGPPRRLSGTVARRLD